jgi:hypothetical protein
MVPDILLQIPKKVRDAVPDDLIAGGTVVLQIQGGILQCGPGVLNFGSLALILLIEDFRGVPQGLPRLTVGEEGSSLIQSLFGVAGADPDLFKGAVYPVESITGRCAVSGHGNP